MVVTLFPDMEQTAGSTSRVLLSNLVEGTPTGKCLGARWMNTRRPRINEMRIAINRITASQTTSKYLSRTVSEQR